MKNRQIFNAKHLIVGLSAGVAASAFGVGISSSDSVAQAHPPVLTAPMAQDGFTSVADLVEKVSPAVVSILVEREVASPRLPSGLEDFFQFRFGDPRDQQAPFGDGKQTMQAQGSGFFIDADGHIVTNNHVIDEASAVSIVTSNGDELKAEIIGTDPLTDLAVLKVKAPKTQRFVKFSQDVNLRVGDRVVAVGNPFGLSGTVTSGIVSAIGRAGGQFTDYIQIDAPINRGNSGGPTFDLQGRVVGVNTAIYSTNGGSVGIGFAIPAKLAQETVKQLISKGAVTRGWLGVSLQPVTKELASALGRDNEKGALVAEVLPDTPAQAAGLRDGDLVLALNGKAIEDTRDLSRSVSALSPGQKAKVKVLRDGKEKILNVKLGERGEDTVASVDKEGSANDPLADDLGLRLAAVDDNLRQQYRIPDGVDGLVVIGVRAGSPAEEAGLQRGTVILQADGEKVSSTSDLKSKIDNAKNSGRDAVLLRMQVGGVKRFGALPLAHSGE